MRTLEEFKKLTGIRAPETPAERWEVYHHPTPEELARREQEYQEYLEGVERWKAENPELWNSIKDAKLPPPPPLMKQVVSWLLRRPRRITVEGFFDERGRPATGQTLLRELSVEVERCRVWIAAARQYGDPATEAKYLARLSEMHILMMQVREELGFVRVPS